MKYKLMQLIKAIVIGFIFSLGAIPVVVYTFQTGSGEYFYFITYKIMSIVLLIMHFIFGCHIYFRLQACETFASHWRKYFMCGLMSWLVTIIVLTILNYTPLCIGQENGDGYNDIFSCTLGTIGNSLLFTPRVLIGITLASFLSAAIYRGISKQIK
jgi:hypothetical protein